MHLSFFTKLFGRSVQLSSNFGKTFSYVRDACWYKDNVYQADIFRKNNTCTSCVFNGFKYIMLYSVQLKNKYSYLNSSLKLSEILNVVSPVNNRIATYYHYTNSSSSFILFITIFYFFHLHHVYLIPSDANDPEGLMRR